MGVVEKGHKIYIPSDKLTSTEITVNWQQNFSQKSAQYYSVPFINKDSGDEESIIFIQKSYLDSIRNKAISGDSLTVVVDDSFQYGQDKEKRKRWLVFHDKNNKAFQWRFVEGMVSKLGNAAVNFANGALKSFGVDIGVVKGIFGDYLRNF